MMSAPEIIGLLRAMEEHLAKIVEALPVAARSRKTRAAQMPVFISCSSDSLLTIRFLSRILHSVR